MTDHTTTEIDALRNLDTARLAGQFTRAVMTATALSIEAEHIDPITLADIAFDIWNAFHDGSVDIPDSLGTDIIMRLEPFLPDRTTVNMADTLFGDRRAEVCLHDGRAVTWLPDDDVLVITRPAVVAWVLSSTSRVLVRDSDTV